MAESKDNEDTPNTDGAASNEAKPKTEATPNAPENEPSSSPAPQAESEPSKPAPKKKKKKTRKKKSRPKAPGMFSFVAVRQYFMIFAAVGMATSLHSFIGEDANFMVVMIIFAVPSLIHGQLWKWTFDWDVKHQKNLRMGQVAIGALHVALCAWALSRVASGELPFEDAALYHGLTIAGLAAGLWETVRPAMELRNAQKA
ncbi:MAG: hypothetical protein ACI9MC_002347 [Kiritimatiellia bacterium]|jgi:hypothetical protein